MKRRDFIKNAGIAAGTAAAATTVAAPAVWGQGQDIQLEDGYHMAAEFPVLQVGAERFAKHLTEATEGRINIKVFAGGELVPPLGVFDAVSNGTVECGSGASYYWAGKVPAGQWFSSVPFGLNPQGINSWFYAGDGLKLWRKRTPRSTSFPGPKETPACRWVAGSAKR